MTNVDPHDPPPSDPLAVMLPRATRFRRKLVWGGLAVAGVTLAGVLAYGFLHSPTSSMAKKGDIQTASSQKPVRPDMGSFPQDYSQIKPVQAAAPAPTGGSQQAPPASAPKGSGQPREEVKEPAANVCFPHAPRGANLQP